jgi:phosphocarrier protein HPr
MRAGDSPPSRLLEIRNSRGLHARAAAKFVRCAEEFNAEVLVERQEMAVSGQSIMGLMMLAAALGTTIFVSAQGPDAEAALEALTALVENRFDED